MGKINIHFPCWQPAVATFPEEMQRRAWWGQLFLYLQGIFGIFEKVVRRPTTFSKISTIPRIWGGAPLATPLLTGIPVRIN